jgi:predicted AAA+ superfamily ATPase
MKRDIEKELLAWKDKKDRYPLLIRGARQVGKSYLVENFAKNHFKSSVIINFEFQPRFMPHPPPAYR